MRQRHRHSSPAVQDLILTSLDRYADLGVDGFRFDLASVLSRHRPFVDRLDEWAARRHVTMVAELWDAAGTYELGRHGRAGAGRSGTTAIATTSAASSVARGTRPER